MNSPVEMPPVRKTLGIVLLVGAVIVVLEFAGVGPMVREAGTVVAMQVKNIFTRLFSKPASGT